MGGGFTYGEPYNPGYRNYPPGGARAPVFNPMFPPRRESSFWGNVSSPEEVTNLARKRKLEKGEPLGESGRKNAREIVVDDPVKLYGIGNSSRPHGSTEAPRSLGFSANNVRSSPPASPSRNGPKNLGASGRIVEIPVRFKSEKSVPIVPPDGTKKPKRTPSEDAAASLIQSVWRGHELRRLQPLKHLKTILHIRRKLMDIEQQLSDAALVQLMRTDMKTKLRITESIMELLLRLDSLQGVHPVVRERRKAVTKEVVRLQEKVDVLLKGRDADELTSRDYDDGRTTGVDPSSDSFENDNLMSDGKHRESGSETENVNDDLTDDIVLDQLKLHEEEENDTSVGVGDITSAIVMDDTNRVNEDLAQFENPIKGEIYGEEITEDEVEPLLKNTATAIVGNAVQGENYGEKFTEAEVEPLLKDTTRGGEQTASMSRDVGDDEEPSSEIVISKQKSLNEDRANFAESLLRQDTESRRDSFANSSMDVTEDASDRWTDAADHSDSHETLNSRYTSPVIGGSRGMEVGREPPHQQAQNWAGFRSSDESCECVRQPEQAKMKDFLQEISSCPKETVSSDSPCAALLHVAEEMDCHGPPGIFSDQEDADGGVASPQPPGSPGSNVVERVGVIDRTEDSRLRKLSEENKMLKSLLLDVMKWNQLQANCMRDVTERLGKLEERLNKKEKKSTNKPQNRCSKSRLERRQSRRL